FGVTGANTIFDMDPIDPAEMTPEQRKQLGYPPLSGAPAAPAGVRPGTNPAGMQPPGQYARTTPGQPVYPSQPGQPATGRPITPGAPAAPGAAGSLQALQQQQLAEWLPEYCLVRLIDENVQAGFSYQYRIQVKMLNPSFKRRDLVAYDSLADKPEIEGVWSR